MIKLHVEPNTIPQTWEVFMETRPGFSIALDGYVSAGPKFELNSNRKGPYLNLNHHEGVSRLETRATCAQALYNVRLGLYEVFKNSTGEPHANLYVNDCDHDVCLSTYILRNPHKLNHHINPRLNQLVHLEDILDTTAGAYPFPSHMPSFSELNWLFQPYDNFKNKGGLDRRDVTEFRTVIDEVGYRISEFLTGKYRTVPLNTSYELIEKHSVWCMVKEIGQNARMGLFNDGINAFVSVRERPDKRFGYSIGRVSIFIPFPIPKIIECLNKAEGCQLDIWGGSPTIGGSPRVNGSKLNPQEVTEVISEVLSLN